ncbi:hypothetical protein MUP35_00160, partial [Patescibacteria group bacterium]|nr:hypothetical protein [Patescibacteria group bacterium]
EAGGIFQTISVKELLKNYPLDGEYKNRAKGFLNRIEKLAKDYENYQFFEDKESKKIRKIKIIRIKSDQEESGKIAQAEKIGYKFLKNLESFYEKTAQIKTHIDDRPTSGLSYKELQQRSWLVAWKIAKEEGRGKAFLEIGSNRTFLGDTFFAPWKETAKKILEIEVVNDHPYFETNPLEEALKLFEMGAEVEFKRDNSNKEFLAATFFLKKDNRIVGKELKIYPKANKNIPQA